MRKFLNFQHTASAIGLAGGLSRYVLTVAAWPEPASIDAVVALRDALLADSNWLIRDDRGAWWTVPALSAANVAIAIRRPGFKLRR